MSYPGFGRVLLSVLMTGLLSGCASYYSHYALFPASNSAGDPRQVRLSWQTAEYPDWWIGSDDATDIKLETQCSKRVWQLTDATGGATPCGEGIVGCGVPGRDLAAGSGRPVDSNTVCLNVESGDGSSRIAELGQQFSLTVSCLPVQTTRTIDGESQNVDYLRASVVPYIVHARKVPRGSLAQRAPELDDSVCKEK